MCTAALQARPLGLFSRDTSQLPKTLSRQFLSTSCTPQALYSTFAASDSLAPAAVAGAVSAVLFAASRAGRIPDALKPLMRNLLGWTATLLFMFQPLAQLVSEPVASSRRTSCDAAVFAFLWLDQPLHHSGCFAASHPEGVKFL